MRRSFSLLGPVVTLALCAAPLAASAGTLRLEAEKFTATHDLGGTRIAVKGCGDASEGFAVDGLDMHGEWIKLRLILSSRHCFVDSLRSAGGVGLVRNFEIVFTTLDETPLFSDNVETIPGSGFS